MRSSCVMFVAAVCILFLVKLKWPKNKSVNDFHRCIRTSKQLPTIPLLFALTSFVSDNVLKRLKPKLKLESASENISGLKIK